MLCFFPSPQTRAGSAVWPQWKLKHLRPLLSVSSGAGSAGAGAEGGGGGGGGARQEAGRLPVRLVQLVR